MEKEGKECINIPPLMQAAQSGDCESLQDLILARAHVNAVNDSGYTALILAAEYNNV